MEVVAISTAYRHNEQIRISPVRLINQNEEQVGIVSTSEALRMSREAGLDLVEVAPNARPPVCRIMDYGKWRYQQQKKEDKSRASNRGGQLKELKLKTVKIGDHDLLIKINHAREFLKEGNKVQFTLQFRGREMAHIDLGRDLFKKIKDELFAVSKIERDSKMEGRRMTLVLQPEMKTGPKAVAPPAPAGVRPGSAMSAGSALNIPRRAPASDTSGATAATATPTATAPGATAPAATAPAAATPAVAASAPAPQAAPAPVRSPVSSPATTVAPTPQPAPAPTPQAAPVAPKPAPVAPAAPAPAAPAPAPAAAPAPVKPAAPAPAPAAKPAVPKPKPATVPPPRPATIAPPRHSTPVGR